MIRKTKVLRCRPYLPAVVAITLGCEGGREGGCKGSLIVEFGSQAVPTVNK